MSISCLRIIFQLHLFRVTVDFQFIHILPAEIIQIAFRNSSFLFVQHPRIHRNPQNRRWRSEVILCSVELEVNPSLAPHYYSQDSAKASITSFFVFKSKYHTPKGMWLVIPTGIDISNQHSHQGWAYRWHCGSSAFRPDAISAPTTVPGNPSGSPRLRDT